MLVMFNIQQYLQKFRTLTSNESEVRDAVVAVLHERYGIEIERDAVKYQNKQIFIRAHPLIKNEIAQHKKELLIQLKPRISYIINDIR